MKKVLNKVYIILFRWRMLVILLSIFAGYNIMLRKDPSSVAISILLILLIEACISVNTFNKKHLYLFFYNGKEYPIRELSNGWKVAQGSLNELIEDNPFDEDLQEIDEKIIFFLSEEEWEWDDKYIIRLIKESYDK